MDQGTDDIQRSIAETRQDIEETRASMTEKLELLEERVRETVETAKSTAEDIMTNVKETVDETVGAVKETVGDARSTVEGIVDNVKETMDDTMTMVKRSFDMEYQVNHHPWTMLGGSVLMGYMLGCWTNRPTSSSSAPARHTDYTERHADYTARNRNLEKSGYFATVQGLTPDGQPLGNSSRAQRSGVWSSTLGQFGEEFNIIKGALIGALMGSVRDLVRQSLPNVAPQLEKAIDSATRKMGAKPINGAPNQHDQSHANQEHELHQQERAANGPSRTARDQVTI